MSGYTVEVNVGIWTSDNVIHTWLTITHPDGVTKEAWGFHPATEGLGNAILGKGDVQAENPNKTTSASSGPLPMTEQQYKDLQKYITRTDANPPNYSLPNGSQCTHWALRGLNEAGLIPSILSPEMNPGNPILGILRTIAWNPLTQWIGFTALNNWRKNMQSLQTPNSLTYRIVWVGSDPLALDLDGDGLETVAANGYSGALFDHDNDGIKTATGWIKSDDGLLVRDINGDGIINNGSELFGDSTQLANGQTAAQGFAALADLDSNADGKVDASDTAFNELKIWRDLNQDGISQTNELSTLADLGILNLNTASNISLQNTAAGQQILAGSFTRTDGTTSTIADLTFRQDTFYSEYIDHIEIPEELQHLPNIQGMGRLRDLREAAALSPALADVLGQYAAVETRTEQKALIDQLLLEWAKTDPQYSDAPMDVVSNMSGLSSDPNSEFVIYLRIGQAIPMTSGITSIDEIPGLDELQQRLRVLDAVKGDKVTTKVNGLSVSTLTTGTNKMYNSLADAIYGVLLTQTRFEKYLNQVELSITETSISLDTSKITQMFQDRISTDPLNGVTDLIEFNRYAGDMLTGTGWENGEWRDFRNGNADTYLSERQRRSV